ncbi:hypothetical protein SDC9_121991 [bioreactor metagenome]|uniref:Uncharacterized protein n=1 Tax=bioreactor metagenome TaxID=1076179 RepID=A0A645CDJ9_9ZZZZ
MGIVDSHDTRADRLPRFERDHGRMIFAGGGCSVFVERFPGLRHRVNALHAQHRAAEDALRGRIRREDGAIRRLKHHAERHRLKQKPIFLFIGAELLLHLLLRGNILQNAVCPLKITVLIVLDAPLERNINRRSVLMQHPKFAVDLAALLKDRKPLPKRLPLFRQQKIPEPMPNDLIIGVSKQVEPLLIDLQKIPGAIEGLVAKRRLVKQGLQPLFRGGQLHLNGFKFLLAQQKNPQKR